MPTESTRRKRFTNNPVLNDDGKSRAIPPQLLGQAKYKLYRAILKALAHDRFLSADYLGLLTGTSYAHASNVCAVLRSEPHAYIKACDEQAENSQLYLYTKDQYELTPLGIQAVLDHFGIVLPPRRKTVQHIAHQIMSDHAMASFRVGVAQSAGRFAMLTRDELLTHPNTPEMTRNSDTPDFIPLGDQVKSEGGKLVDHYIRPDREMFVIRDLERRAAYFFPGFEVGRGTERIEAPTAKGGTKRHDHSYMESKFEDYIRIIQKKIYRSHFGAPNVYIPFLEPNIHRFTTKMLPLFADMTRQCPEVRKYFLFKVHHEFTKKYTASGVMLTEPFLIVGEDGRTAEFSMV